MTEIIRESDAEEGVVVSPEEGTEPQNQDLEVPAEGNDEPEMVEKIHLDEINHRLGNEINARAEAQKQAIYYKSLVDQQNKDNHKDEVELGDPLEKDFGSKLMLAVGNVVKESENRIRGEIQASYDRETMKEVLDIQKKNNLTDDQLEIVSGLVKTGKAGGVDHAINIMRGNPVAAPLSTQPNKRLGLPGLNNSAATVPTRTGTTNDRAASSILPSQEEIDRMPKEQLNQLERDVKAEKIQLNTANITLV